MNLATGFEDYETQEIRFHTFRDSPYSGNWTLGGLSDRILLIKKIRPLLVDDKIQKIKLKEIAWRDKHHFPYRSGNNCWCCGGIRYANCDVSYPGIIAYNAPNPYDNKYRMIDGRHRIMKLLFHGKKYGLFYVFDFEELKPLVQHYE